MSNSINIKKNSQFPVNLLNHGAFWFVSLFATPMFIAINNSGDILMSMGALALMLAISCIALTGITSTLGQLAGNPIAQRAGLLMAGFALVLAIQCNLVHDLFFYGNFNGEKINFRSNPVSFRYEWYGFLVAMVLITAGLQWLRPKGPWIAILSIASSSLLLIPALPVFNVDSRPFVADQNVDPSVFEFSRNGNVIHLLPDGLQSDIAAQVMQENPEIAAEFEGFTFYTNHLGMFQGTAPSVPTILTGQAFDLGQGHDYEKVIPHIESNGYPSVLKEAGYQLDYVLISKAYCATEVNSCYQRPFNDMKSRGYYRHRAQSRSYSLRVLADLTLFRLFPSFIKEKIYNDAQWYFSDTTLDGSSPWPDPVIREWSDNMVVTDGPPVFKWYHYVGTHMPPHWDAQCKRHQVLERSRENYYAQTYCILKGIAVLITELKKNGIYDDTVFVITGDHGVAIPPRDDFSSSQQSALSPRMVGSARPAFLIKGKHAQHSLRFSHAPTSLIDVAPTVLALAGFEQQNSQPSAMDFTEQSTRLRYFTPYSIPEFFNKKPVPHVVYQVDGDVRDSSSWRITQINAYKTAPSLYDPINYNSGYGFIYGARFSRSDPDNGASWINGRQLAFLISQPKKQKYTDSQDALRTRVAELQIAFHLSKWIPEQNMSISVNGNTVVEKMAVESGKGYWNRIKISLADVELKAENNFVSLQFSHSYLPPNIKHFEVAAMILSIRLAMVTVSDTNTTAAAPP